MSKIKMAKSLNPYLSSLSVMYFKLHNLHWNVVGKNFKEVHEYIETIYDAVALKLDEVAEKIKMNFELPYTNMNEFLENSIIKEIPSQNYSVKDAIKILSDDLVAIKDQAEKARLELAEDDAFTATMMLEDHVTFFEKEVWFSKSMLL